MEKVKILFLALAYPSEQKLEQVREVKEIDEVVKQSKYRNQIDFQYKAVTELSDLQKYILEEKPQIVHFSSHGNSGELYLINYHTENGELISTKRTVPVEFLENVFAEVKEYVNCVVLSSCHSEKQAKKIAENVPYVIGTTKNILDNNATEFAKEFYRNVGDGKDLAEAFRQALVAVAAYLRNEFNKSDFIALTKPGVENLVLVPISLASKFVATLKNARLQGEEGKRDRTGSFFEYNVHLENIVLENYDNFLENGKYIQQYKLNGKWLSKVFQAIYLGSIIVDRPWGSNNKPYGNFTTNIKTIDGILSKIQIDVNRYDSSANNYAADKVEQLIKSTIKETVRIV